MLKQNYKLEFHNFDDVVNKDEAETFRRNTPDILSDESERNISFPSSHVEGSRAFSRYRTIDIDMKKDLVKILEGKQ